MILGGTPRYWSARVGSTSMQPSAQPLTPPIAHVVALG